MPHTFLDNNYVSGAGLRRAGVFAVLLCEEAAEEVLPELTSVFASVDEEFEPRNLLPARLFYCRPKPSNGASSEASHAATDVHLPQFS